MDLSELIKKHRKMLKMTQNDMATILGVHRATYGEYELGNNQPPIDKLIKIADVFDVSIDYLLGRERVRATDVEEILSRTFKISCFVTLSPPLAYYMNPRPRCD